MAQPRQHDRRPLLASRVGQLLLAATLAGLLVAGLLVPLVAGVGKAAKASSDSFQDLPSELATPPLPQASRILAADGSTLATFYYENRVSVPLAQVPAVMRTAIISIEDSRFYEHHGVDLRGVVRAAATNRQAGSVQQGGSTLTQQYVKNVLLESARTDAARKAAVADTVTRKLREARYALALEQRMSKDKILEGYLNIAYFGDGAYGVAAASKRYFGKPVEKLTLPEAALLAGLVRNPYAYDPILHPAAAKTRRDVVLQRMADLHKISRGTAARAKSSKIVLHPTQPGNGCDGTKAAFFCDYVVNQQLKRDPALGATVADRVKLLLRGGVTIRTSLDPKVQQAAQAALLKHTKITDRVAAAANVVEPGTGLIKAMAVNRIYDSRPKPPKGHTSINLATGGALGVQGGSTFKIFTLTAALEEHIPLDTKLNCPGHYVSPVFFKKPGVPYEVNNDEPGNGTYDLRTATAKSVNTCFIQLEERTGVAKPVAIAESMNVRNLNGEPLTRNGSFTLGTDSVSPLAMAGVYATYAAHGTFCPPSAILSITDSRGHAYPATQPQCRQVLDSGIADTVTSVLRGVITSGTGTGAAIGRPAAGKTGTAQNYSAAWFDGYVPQLAAAVWMGDPRSGPKYPLRHVRIGGHYYPHVFGGTISAPIWGTLMRKALKDVPVEQFAGPDATVAQGRRASVPDVTGMTVRAARAVLRVDGLTGVVAGRVAAGGRAGRVVYTSPGAGSDVGYGSAVSLYLSNGQATVAVQRLPAASAHRRTAPRPSPTRAAPAPARKHRPHPVKTPPTLPPRV